MSFLTSWFKRRQPEDFESVLTRLKTDIQRKQTHLSELRLRERRATLLITLWTLAFWALYSSAWYAQPGIFPLLVGRDRGEGVDKVVKAIPAVSGPIVILFARRIVQTWYSRKAVAEEKTLQSLRKEQRQKVEEFKKKTKYYETRNLLEQFDETPSDGTPRKRPSAPNPSTPQGTPQRPVIKTPGMTPAKGGLPPHLAVTPAQPQQPPRKQWFDKVADVILGDDDGSGGSSANRYALICQHCFAHNGLVKESMWEDAQYLCPKCGQFNPSARSVREGTSTVPATPATAISMRPTPITSRAPAHFALPHPTTGVPMMTPQASMMAGGRQLANGGMSGLAPPAPAAPAVLAARTRKKSTSLSSASEEEEEEAEGYSMEVNH